MSKKKVEKELEVNNQHISALLCKLLSHIDKDYISRVKLDECLEIMEKENREEAFAEFNKCISIIRNIHKKEKGLEIYLFAGTKAIIDGYFYISFSKKYLKNEESINISFKDGDIKVNLLNIEKATKEDIIASTIIYQYLKNIINEGENEDE